jgi:hypothetical protein
VKREKSLAVAVLLGVAAAWFWFVTHQGGDLLPHGSVRITSVSSWKEPSRRLGPSPVQKIYFWTTQGDLLHLEQNADGSTAVVRDRLTLFNTLQRDDAPPVQIPNGSLFLRPTSDGNGLLYGKTNLRSVNGFDVHLLDANGKNDRLLSAFWVPNVAWMPDGKHWIASRFDADYLNSLDGTPARKLDTKSLSAWTPFVLGVTPQSRAISAGGSDQFEPPTPFQRGNSIRYPTAVLTEFDPAAPARSPKSWNVTMPPQSVRGKMMLSPQADRILWIVEKQSSWVSSWLSRLPFAYNRPYSGDEAIYVSQLNGTGMRQLFSAPTQRQRRGPTTMIKVPLTEIQWLPDGKRISFVYEDSLYLASVD